MTLLKTRRKGEAKVEHAHTRRGEVHELLTLGARFHAEKKYEEAWQCAMAALNRDMDSAGAMYFAGQIAMEYDYPGLAANLLRRSCALRPDVYSNWLGFGAALLDMRAFDAAYECFEKAIKIAPDEPTGYANMSALELNRGKPQECINWANKAIDLMPEGTLQGYATRGNRGFAYLMLRRWAEGFDEYRYSMAGKHRVRRIYRQPEEPEWDGTPGQTVVVQTEQGLGDEISFASMIPDLVKVSKKVIIDSHPSLANLMKRSFPECDVYGTRKSTDLTWPLDYEIDASVPMSSLGSFFRRKDEDFPRKPWLVADPTLRAKWREWLDSYPGLKCGIAWTGGIFLTNREGRSATLEEFDRVMVPGATYISLEYRDEERSIDEWNAKHPDRKVIRPPINRADYDDTVALLAELDHVISVTTTVIHACGGLGRSCDCIVPSVLTSSQWRYAISGDEMPWYPQGSVRMWRQARSENGLSMVIARIAKEWKRRIEGAEKKAA